MASRWNVNNGDKSQSQLKTGLDTQFFYDRALSKRHNTVRIIDPAQGRLVARALLSGDNYGYQISNSWDSTGSIVDTLVNTIGGMITGPTGKMVAQTIGNIGDIAEGLGMGSNNIIQKAGDIAEKYSNAHIVSASELQKSFHGTTVKFNGSDSISFKLIHDKNGNNVVDQVRKLHKYAIGGLEDALGLENWIGVQSAPNGYEWKLTDSKTSGHVDHTLKMFIGTYMMVDNLLVEDLKVDFSPQCVMVPNGNRYDASTITSKTGKTGVIITKSGKGLKSSASMIKGQPGVYPLYASVTISFTYARMITLNDLENSFWRST